MIIKTPPPSKNYRDNFDAIFKKDKVECQCSFAIKICGDGCQYCNPVLNEELTNGTELPSDKE